MNALLLTMLTLTCHQSAGEPPLLETDPLINALGGDYKARTDATRKLSAMGEAARPALLKAAAADDREVSRRAEMLLFWLDQAHRKKAVAMIDAAFPAPLPWLDLAYIAPCDDIARTILEPIYFASGDGPEPRETCPECWGRYRMATRSLCYQMAEAGVPLWAIRIMVAELAAREAKWMESYRGSR